ncbi:hypothetical protein D3C77_654500 [compost metagenome]
MPNSHERAPGPREFANQLLWFWSGFGTFFHVAPDVLPECQQLRAIAGGFAYHGDLEVILEIAVGVADGVRFFVPAQHDKAADAVQFGHVGIDAYLGGVPVQRYNTAQVFWAK